MCNSNIESTTLFHCTAYENHDNLNYIVVVVVVVVSVVVVVVVVVVVCLLF